MDYSIVIPVKNEANNLKPLIEEIEQSINPLGFTWELIFVDDGSTDETSSILTKLKKDKPFLKVLSLDKNYGQSTAMWAGFNKANGEKIISLDGDGQNDPRDIPHLIEAMGEHDLICGWRQQRKDTFFKRLISKVANRVRNLLCSDGLHDTGCTLKIYRKQALLQLPPFNGMHRFLPALFAMRGFSIKELPVHHRPRNTGTSHYNIFNRGLNTIKDMLGVYWLGSRSIRYAVKEFVE